jgi:putative Holliday junction resolvase
MKRIIGLDLGSKTLGICISDPLKITTNPFENFVFEENNYDSPINKLKEVVNVIYKDQIETIVLGYPLRMTGTKSEFTLVVERFYERLLKEFPTIKISLEDERLTTKQSMEIMKLQNIKSKNKKANKDVISACIILKNRLDRL